MQIVAAAKDRTVGFPNAFFSGKHVFTLLPKGFSPL